MQRNKFKMQSKINFCKNNQSPSKTKMLKKFWLKSHNDYPAFAEKLKKLVIPFFNPHLVHYLAIDYLAITYLVIRLHLLFFSSFAIFFPIQLSIYCLVIKTAIIDSSLNRLWARTSSVLRRQSTRDPWLVCSPTWRY